LDGPLLLVAAGTVDPHLMQAWIDPQLSAQLVRIDARVIEHHTVAIPESLYLDTQARDALLDVRELCLGDPQLRPRDRWIVAVHEAPEVGVAREQLARALLRGSQVEKHRRPRRNCVGRLEGRDGQRPLSGARMLDAFREQLARVRQLAWLSVCRASQDRAAH